MSNPRQDKPRKPRRRDPVLDRKVAELQERHGLDRSLATQVATGKASLNEVLSRLAMGAEVESLMRRHDLSRALATQVALGQADIASVLRKRRQQTHLDDNRDRSALESALRTGRPLAIGLHAGRVVEARVTAVDRYEFTIQPRDGQPEVIHKLQAKFACDVADRKKARRSLRYDDALKATPREPIWKPQERYTCSNRRLFGYLDEKTQIQVTLLEGEVFRGELAWIGRYEFGLALKGGVELVVFRHALADLRTA